MEPAAREKGRGLAAFSCGRQEEEAGARVLEEGSQTPGEQGLGHPLPWAGQWWAGGQAPSRREAADGPTQLHRQRLTFIL